MSNTILPEVLDTTITVTLSVDALPGGRLNVGPGFTLMISQHRYIDGSLDSDAEVEPMIFDYFDTMSEALAAAQKYAKEKGL